MTPPTGTIPAPEGGVAAVPRRAEGVELLGQLDGSGYTDAPVLVRRGDGQTLQVTPLLATLLDLVDGERDDAALAAALSDRTRRGVTPTDVRFLLDEKLAPLGLLHVEGAEPATAVKSNPLLALRFKVVASNPEATRRLTSPFTWLFRSAVVVPVMVAFAVVCWWVLVEKGLASATRSAFYDPKLLLAVLGLTVLSAGLHEFGHAAACRYGGATPGAMGAGLYVVWPAFYTDVDDSYRLSRWGRLRVDLGGLYFNALIAVGIGAWWLVSREDALLLGVATQLLQMLRQLAPYVRADGYHILADLTGVPDLFAHMKPTLLALLPWRWGKPTGTPLKRWARVVVSAWVLVVVPLLVALLLTGILLLPRLVATAWDSGQQQWAVLGDALGDGDVVTALGKVFALVALVLPVAAVSYLLVSLVRAASTFAWRKTEGRPTSRTASVLAGAVLLAALGWAWWPDGQYTPVRADERGTLTSLVSSPSALRAAPARAEGTPVTAMALVPRVRDGKHPVVLLVKGEDGSLRSILTPDGGDSTRRPGQAFPFTLPDGPQAGDNQALAVNDEDGTVEYDVAVALVYVTDGAAALNANEAYALASCTACTTVAVAFQVVLVVGQSNVIAPTNAAVAGNSACVACATAALAVQLVVSLSELPDEEVQAKLDAALGKLDGIEGDLDVGEVYRQVKAVEAEVLDVLTTAGLVTGVERDEAAASASPSASPTSGGTSAAATPTGSASASASPTPTVSAEPSDGSPSPSAPPSEAPSPSVTP